MIDGYTHDRLCNWARWSRSGRGVAGRCQSAEWRYEPEHLRGDAEADRRTPLPEIDVRDAVDVWRAINPVNGFPKLEYLLLSAHYIWRLSGYELVGYCRRHGTTMPRDAEAQRLAVERAVHMARNRLRRGLACSAEVGYNPPSRTVDGSAPLKRLQASVVPEGSLID